MNSRRGFVSNSSSSSFVIIGRVIDFGEIGKSDMEQVYIHSYSGGDGADFFKMTPEMYSFLDAHLYDAEQELEFYKVFYKRPESDDTLMTKNELVENVPDGEKFSLIPMVVSMHSSVDFSGMVKMYFPKCDDEVKEYLDLARSQSSTKKKLQSIASDIKRKKERIEKDPVLKRILKEKKKIEKK